MHSRLSFYRFAFIVNIIANIGFVGYAFYNVFFNKNINHKDDAIGFTTVGIFFTIYKICNLLGLDLTRRLKQNETVSRSGLFVSS